MELHSAAECKTWTPLCIFDACGRSNLAIGVMVKRATALGHLQQLSICGMMPAFVRTSNCWMPV